MNFSNAGHVVETADFFATSRQPLPESEDKILLCLSDRREHNEGLRGIINIGLGDGPGGILLESSSF